jgi:cell division topological specificity factor
MKLLSFFSRPSSAPVARERLQVLLAHERTLVGQSDLIAILREEILAVIAKHVPMKPDKVQVKMERGEAVSTLEVEVEIPMSSDANVAANIGRAGATLDGFSTMGA